MSRSQIFLNNAATSAALHLVTLIAGFIVPRIMLTVYGSEINGLVTSITQFVAYFNLVEAGLASAAVYSLYQPLANKDQAGINAILSAARHFYNRSGYIFISLVMGCALIYPVFIKSNAISPWGMGILVVILGCQGALEFFTMAKYRVLLTADQKIYVLSIASICAIILSTAIIAILAAYEVNIVIVRGVAVLGIFLRSAILWLYVKLRYSNLNYFASPNYQAMESRWDAFYLQILGSVHTGAPIIIATFFTDLKSVSVYAIYNMVLGGITGALSIAISGLYSSFGEILAQKKLQTFQQAYQEFELAYYMLITWAYACAWILIMPFIRIYTHGVTDVNYDLPLIGALFVLNGLLYNIKTPQGMLVFSAGLFKETKMQTTLQGIIAVAGGLIMVQFWGLAGILLGAILSNLYRDIDLMFFMPRHVTKLPVRKTFFRICRAVLGFGLAILPFQYITLSPASYVAWVKWAFPVGAYALLVVFLLNLLFEHKMLLYTGKRFYKVFARKHKSNECLSR